MTMTDTDREAVERLIFDCNSTIVALGRDILADCDFTLRALLDAKEVAETERDGVKLAAAVVEESIGKVLAACNDLENRGIDRGYRIDRDWVSATLAQINKETEDG